ncbi:MAG: hypothetical protein IPG04_19065 [Polyangiaceae bacterium]|nr:hypothetical protein [Polyangiaceae bacterium]
MSSADPTPPPSGPSAPKPAGVATGAAPVDDAPAPAELRRIRFGRSKAPSWLWVALPIAGLSVVPLVGLAYTATTTFGKGGDTVDSASSADALDDEDGATGAAVSKKKTPAKKSTARAKGSRPRSDSAGACCTALHELGKTEPIDQRGRYLSAAAACEAAPDADTALKRVASSLRLAKIEPPPECEAGAE